MPDRRHDCHVVHSDIRLERSFAAPPSRVFAAWSSPEALLTWSAPGEGWSIEYETFDFRVGGRSRCRFGPHGGESFLAVDQYEDIAPDRRLVMFNTMTSGDKRLFVGMVSVEFYAAGRGCDMLFTEQGAFLDGHDKPENHLAGWTCMLDQLGATFATAPA